jgi:phage protein D
MNIELSKQSMDLVVRATGLRVVDEASHALATELRLAGTGMVKQIKDFFAPLKQDAHASWKRLCDTETAELAKITPTLTVLDRDIAGYRAEQARIRREAEEKARRQEEERRRLEEEAFRRAQEKERQAREATERAAREQNAAARRKAQEEAARAQAEADKIIAKAAAEEKKFEPVAVVPERIANDGLAMRDNWTFEIVDNTLVPRDYMLVDEVKIGKVVRAASGKIEIPGVRIFNQPSMMKTR